MLKREMKDKKTQGTPHPLKHELTQNCQIAERNNFRHTKKLERLRSLKKEKEVTKRMSKQDMPKVQKKKLQTSSKI